MSELRSVIAFFLGLVFFIIIIGLVIGRIRLPGRQQQVAKVSPTPTVSAILTPTRGSGLLDRIAGIFRRKSPTPTPKTQNKPQPTGMVIEIGGSSVNSEMKQALQPQEAVGDARTTKGGQVIPESGAPTLLLPFSLLLGGLGLKLRKRS